jgi:hypothetical protein
LSLIFDLFKSVGCSEIYHEDIQLIIQVNIVTLNKLWYSIKWEQNEINEISEELADNAFVKVLFFLLLLNYKIFTYVNNFLVYENF